MVIPNKSTLQIVSGGQTGVDRAALDAAMEHGASVGGWCPEGRLAEDGIIPARYPLRELPGGGYRKRTRQNVIDSDGTAILYFDVLSGGTKLAYKIYRKEAKPFLLINAFAITEVEAINQLNAFISDHGIRILNIAGPRASHEPRGYSFTYAVILNFLQQDSERKAIEELFEEPDPNVPAKTLEELVEEGKISPMQFRSILSLMQTGYGFSSSPEDARYIEEKIQEMNVHIDKEKTNKDK